MRTENNPRPSRLLRVREFTGKVSGKTGESANPGSRKSRFVAPYYFSDEDQATIRETLAGHGLVNAEDVQLFITAAEYEVGSLRAALLEETASTETAAPAPRTMSKADIEQVQLGQSAAQFLTVLQSVHNTARQRLLEALTRSDPFAREHGSAYLSRLATELERIAEACDEAEVVKEEVSEPVIPQIGPKAKRLIQQLARIYRECLDAEPEARSDGPFCRVLCIIRVSAGIEIPCDGESLHDLLS